MNITKSSISILRQTLESYETIPADVAFKMLKTLDKMPIEGLEIIVKENVKFLAVPAITRLMMDHGYTPIQIDDMRKVGA
jgi:hypothetical protein